MENYDVEKIIWGPLLKDRPQYVSFYLWFKFFSFYVNAGYFSPFEKNKKYFGDLANKPMTGNKGLQMDTKECFIKLNWLYSQSVKISLFAFDSLVKLLF